MDMEFDKATKLTLQELVLDGYFMERIFHGEGSFERNLFLFFKSYFMEKKI